MPSKPSHTKHGQATRTNRSREYETWIRMRARCNNPKDKQWSDYGGRGIKVCERWNKFENFLHDMGKRPESLSLDRWPDKNGNYEPSNCRWATSVEQNSNKRNNRNYTVKGVSGNMTFLANYFGLNQRAVWARIDKLGWTPEKAFLTPLRYITRWKQNN